MDRKVIIMAGIHVTSACAKVIYAPGEIESPVPEEYKLVRGKFPMNLDDIDVIPKRIADCVKWSSRNPWIFEIYKNIAQLNAHTIIYGTTHFKPNPKPEKSLDSVLTYNKKHGYPNGTSRDAMGFIPEEITGYNWVFLMGDLCYVHQYIGTLLHQVIVSAGGEPCIIFTVMQTKIAKYMVERWLRTESMETPRGMEMYLGSRNAACRDVLALRALFEKLVVTTPEAVASMKKMFDEIFISII